MFHFVTYFLCVCIGEGWWIWYLEFDFCWKIPYHIQSLCPNGQGEEGGSVKCGQTWTRGEGVKSHKKCVVSFMDTTKALYHSFLERWFLLPSRDFTCSKPTIVTLKSPQQHVFDVNTKDTRTISMTLIWCFYC